MPQDTVDTEQSPNETKDIIPIAKLLALRKKKLSYEQIGKIVGCSKVNVWERLQPYIDEIESLDSYKDNRADLLAIVQHRLVNTLNPTTIEKMSPRDRVLAYGILYDKERLERGQSTQNIETHHKFMIDKITSENWQQQADANTITDDTKTIVNNQGVTSDDK